MSEPSKNNINDTLLSNVQSGDSKNTEALISEYRSVVEAIAKQNTLTHRLNMKILFRRV